MYIKKLGVSFYLFLVFFLGGSFLSISSSDWVGVWFGLEVNLFAVIPFFCGVGLMSEVEAVIKYFIIQSIGSLLLLLGSILLCYEYGFFSIIVGGESLFCVFLCVGLLLKMGVVPFHFWVPSVMSGLSWAGCGVLSIWQKVVPLVILSSVVSGFLVSVVIFFGGLGSLIGGVGGIFQTQLRIIMGYSSIGHTGWLVVGVLFNPVCGFCYFIVYSVMVFSLFLLLNYLDLVSFESLGKLFGLLNINELGFIGSCLVSLAGMPPTIGFAMKWCIFLGLLPDFYLVLVMLVLGSLLSLYYYSCIIITWCVFLSQVWWSKSLYSGLKSGIFGFFYVVGGGLILLVIVSVMCF